MTLLAAGALAWLLLALLFWVLHRLRPPLPQIVVPSLRPYLMPDPGGQRGFWEWLRRHLSLILQLICLAALALALARPHLIVGPDTRQLVVSVVQPGLDPTPLADALAAWPNARHALVLAQPQPRIQLDDASPAKVLETLAEIPPATGGGDLAAALTAAAGLMSAHQNSHGLVLARAGDQLVQTPEQHWQVLSPAVLLLPQIDQLNSRLAGDGRAYVFYEVAGPPGADYEILLESQPWPTVPYPIGQPPPARTGATVNSIAAGQFPESVVVRGIVAAGSPADQQRLWLHSPLLSEPAQAVIGPLAELSRGRVYIDAATPEPWRRAARAAGHTLADGPEDDFEIALYVGRLPERLPAASVVLIDPPEVANLLERGELANDLALANPANRLLSDLPLAAMGAPFRPLRAPPGTQSAAQISTGSLLWQGRLADREIVAMAIDPATALAGQSAFPTLVQRLLAQVDPLVLLQPGVIARVAAPGTLRPDPEADRLVVVDPNGTITLTHQLDPARSLAPDAIELRSAGQRLSWAPQRIGLHWLIQSSDGQQISRTPIWVQNGGPGYLSGSGGGTLALASQGQAAAAWPWLAFLALAGLVAEWTWFHRRRAAF